MKKKDPKKEIEDLKKLREIEKIIQKGDIENAFVSNASKDSETVSEAVADEILNSLESENIESKSFDKMMLLTSNLRSYAVRKKKPTVHGKAPSKKNTKAKVTHSKTGAKTVKKPIKKHSAISKKKHIKAAGKKSHRN